MTAVAIDSSALIALFNGEPEEEIFLEVLARQSALIGWPTIFETRIWLLRKSRNQEQIWFNEWLERAETRLLQFDEQLERHAVLAYERFGKGRHPAKLNFGDCMSYAVAVQHGLPLLFKGGDFGKTDINVHPASVQL